MVDKKELLELTGILLNIVAALLAIRAEIRNEFKERKHRKRRKR